MKLTLDGTPEEIRQFLQTGGAVSAFGSVTAQSTSVAAAHPPAAILSAMTTSKTTNFTPQAVQAVTSNVDTLRKVQSMMSVHEKVFASADFSHETLTSVIHPEIKYYEFNKLITPNGVDGVAQRFAEFNDTFKFGKINNLMTFGDGDYLANVYEVEAEHVGKHEGVAPTNKKVKIGGIGVMKIQDGKITEYYDAYDVGGIRPQVTANARGRRGKRK